MNFYDCLEVPSNASKQEIKQAYCKLVMKYHPDKCSDINSKEKFQEIHTAYEILYDDEKRKEYDEMSIEQKARVYDLIKQYFTELKPEYSYIYDSIIDFIYPEEEDIFKEDVNTFNIKNIFTRIADKINNKHEIKIIRINSKNYDLKISLKERYNELFKYVRVMKNKENNNDKENKENKENNNDKENNSKNYKENNSKNYNEYIIPVCDKEFIINDPDKGIININIIYEEDKNYKIINDYDLLHIKNISLSQYIYGGKIKIYDVNENVSWFAFSGCLEKKPIFLIENKGLPRIINDNKIKNRGNLFVYLNIEGINSIKEDETAHTYYTVVEDMLKLMFPPII